MNTTSNRTRRLHRYLTTAAIGGAAAAGTADAAVITSASVSWGGWTGSVNGTVVQNFNNITRSTNIFGESRMNNAFNAVVGQFGGSSDGTSSNFGSQRQATVSALNANQVNRNFFGTGQVISNGLAGWFGDAVVAGSSAAVSTFWRPRPDLSMAPLQMANSTAADSVQGFLAFRISAGGSDYYYGYFEITMSRDGTQRNGSAFSMAITGWAYENTLNQGITIGGAAAVPGGAGLASLAVGALGLRGRRRSRSA